MNKVRAFSFVSVLALAASFTSVANAATKLEAGEFTIDKAHTTVGFEVPHLGITTVEGRFTEYSGEFKLGDKLSTSSLKAEVETGSIDTGNKDRDKHLRSEDFFDASAHSKLTFVSRKIEGTPGSFVMKGDLTIKGVTKEVAFKCKYNGAINDPYGNRKVGFDATTKISRKEFGLNWNKMTEMVPVVGDTVTITLKVQAAKKKADMASN